MNINSVLLIYLMLAPFASAQESPEEQMEFMRNFFCVMGTQKFLQAQHKLMPPLDDPRNLPVSWRKLLALSFRECLLDTQDQNLLMQLANARSKEDADKISFPFFGRIDVASFILEANYDLSADDNSLLEISQKTTTQILKMQKDQESGSKQGGKPIAGENSGPSNRKSYKPQNDALKVDWLNWAWDSQFRNVFIFSGVAIVLILLNSVVNLFRTKVPVKVEKNPKKKEKQESEKKNSKSKEE